MKQRLFIIFFILLDIAPISANAAMTYLTNEQTRTMIPNVREEKGNGQPWEAAFHVGQGARHESNDGTIMVSNDCVIVGLNLTPFQKQAIDTKSVSGYVLFTPSDLVCKVTCEAIIEASPELKALRDARAANDKEL